MSLFPQPILPLYSVPVLLFDGFPDLLPLPSSSAPSLPSNWRRIGPCHPAGFADPAARVSLMDFFQQQRRSRSRVLLYLGDRGSFDVWQVRTLLRGLQDPLTQVLVLGAASGRLEASPETLFLSSEAVSPFYLLDARLVTAVISFCDGLLAQAALHAQVPLLCVPSRRNRGQVHRLVAARAAIQFPEGFWTESTVRDCMRQLMALEGVTVDESVWEGSRKEMATTIAESVENREWRGTGAMRFDDLGWLGAW